VPTQARRSISSFVSRGILTEICSRVCVAMQPGTRCVSASQCTGVIRSGMIARICDAVARRYGRSTV
jgi:hypothetical protein